MMNFRHARTTEILSYLKSILEEAVPYRRLKLMVVGSAGIGKTSLLQQLRAEGTGKTQQEWAKRVGEDSSSSSSAAKRKSSPNMSTVGVELGEWTYEPKKSKNHPTPNLGPVTFRTWDFAGQREYYATHQYFLSRRALYLALFRVTDGEAGLQQLHQWYFERVF